MKYNYPIELNTYQDIIGFVTKASSVSNDCEILITSGKLVGNAKSLLNMLATVEWGELVCQSNEDIYTLIKPWVKE